jgi:hypothetical protein
MRAVEHVDFDASVRPLRPRPKCGPPRSPQGTAVDPILEALRLLKRRSQIQHELRGRRGSHLAAERELFLIRNLLAKLPAAVQGDGQALWPADLMSGGTARTLAHGRAGRS